MRLSQLRSYFSLSELFPKLRKIVYVLVVTLLGLGGVATVMIVLSPGKHVGLATVISTMFGACLIALLSIKAYVSRVDRAAWSLIALAVFVWVASDTYYSLYISPSSDPPYPSWAEVGYLLFYVLMYIAVGLLIHVRLRDTPRQVWLDALMVLAITGAYLSLIAPQIYAASNVSTMSAFVVSIGNILSGAALVGLFVTLVDLTRAKLSPMWWLLIASGTLLWATDTVYYLTTYMPATAIDLGWLWGTALLAAAAWVPSGGRLRFPVATSGLAAPGVVLLTSATLLIFGTRYHLSNITLLLVVLALLLATVRAVYVSTTLYASAQLTSRAFRDGLTGLRNRFYIDMQLGALSENENTSAVVLVAVKVRSLAGVNEAFGTAAGDALLVEVAHRLRAVADDATVLARYSGAKFALLLVGQEAEKHAEHVSAISAALVEPVILDKHGTVLLDHIMGVVQHPQPGVQLESLPQKSDTTLRWAASMEGAAAYYHTGMDIGVGKTFLLEQKLREALAEGQIICHYQPKLNLATNQVVEVEALARWIRPDGQIVPPDVFLPVIKTAGLSTIFAAQILGETTAQAKLWANAGMNLQVSVNLSVTDLCNPTVVETLHTLMQKHQLVEGLLMVELTETAFVENISEVVDVTTNLHAQGVSFSIDDYGTGHSSLERITALPVKEVKLDRSFVTGVGKSAEIRAVVRSTVDLAHSLGLVLVAEGVESLTDLEALRGLRCDLAQGYYVCPPLSAQNLAIWLAEFRDPLDSNANT